MSKLSDFIDTLDLDVDATYRCDCPVCGGRNTFTVTNDMGALLYNCYKAGCTVHGAKQTNIDANMIRSLLMKAHEVSDSMETHLKDEFVMPPYISPMKPDEPNLRNFMTKWNINYDDVFYDVRQDRVVFPIHTLDGVLVDAVGRSVFNVQPKWLRYGASPVPYVHGKGKTAVIVEDAISAYVIAEYFPNLTGVALLGTQLTDFHKWYIGCFWPDSVCVALDPDARNKTLSIIKELRPLVKTVQGLNIKDDLKYMLEEDVELLEQLVNH